MIDSKSSRKLNLAQAQLTKERLFFNSFVPCNIIEKVHNFEFRKVCENYFNVKRLIGGNKRRQTVLEFDKVLS